MEKPLCFALAFFVSIPAGAQIRAMGEVPSGPALEGLSGVETGGSYELARLYDNSTTNGSPLLLADAEPLPALHAAPETGSIFREGFDYSKRLKETSRFELKTSLSSLSAEQRKVSKILAEAVPHVNAIYRRQFSGPNGDRVLKALRASNDPRKADALEVFERNMGPYDPRNENEPLFDVPAKPKAGFQYPDGTTKEAFDAYVAAHPEQKDELYSPYSNVEKKADGRLVGVPYHDAYKHDVDAIVKILKRAARAAKTPDLKAFLASKAEGIRTDNYEESYGKWVTLKDSPIDLVIGPAETYDDPITSAKEAYTISLYTKDQKGSAFIDSFMGRLPELVKELPIAAENNPYLKDSNYKPKGNMIPVNLVVHGGDSAVGTAAGWTLPNEAPIVAKHGTKMLLIGNVIESRGADVMKVIMERLFGEAYEPSHFYKFVAAHEESHTVLPMTVGFEPKGRALNEVLGDLTMPVEEQKADLLGLWFLDGLVRHGDMTRKEYMDVAKMYVADMIYTTFRDPNEAHGKFQVVCYNMLKERGAIAFDSATGRMTVNDSFPQALTEIVRTFLDIQVKGDKAEAERLYKEKGAQAPEIAKMLADLTGEGHPRRTWYHTELVK